MEWLHTKRRDTGLNAQIRHAPQFEDYANRLPECPSAPGPGSTASSSVRRRCGSSDGSIAATFGWITFGSPARRGGTAWRTADQVVAWGVQRDAGDPADQWRLFYTAVNRAQNGKDPCGAPRTVIMRATTASIWT